MRPLQVMLDVAESSQVGHARRTAAAMATQAGFGEEARGEVSIIATELANNLARYATRGRMYIQVVQRDAQTRLQMLAIDSGPGILDVPRSMQDGVSTGGTPGTGLGAVRRLSHEFDIYSRLDQGTAVFSVVSADRRQARPTEQFEWAGLSIAAPGESVCGDDWRVSEYEGGVGVLVADGLGHGPLAAVAANRAAELFDAESPAQPAAFCERAHRVLSGSRGAALAVGHISSAGKVTYAGVGNICGSIVSSGKTRGLSSQNGTAGLVVRRVQEFGYDWPDRGVMIMHSDGLTQRWSFDDYPGLAFRHPAIIAGVLQRDYVRGKDDATVVVVKRKAEGV